MTPSSASSSRNRSEAVQSRDARAAERASSSAAASGSRSAPCVRQDREDTIEIPQRLEGPARISRRQGPSFDPPVELPDEVKEDRERSRDVQVVVQRRSERITGRFEDFRQVDVVSGGLLVRAECRDGGIEPVDRCRGSGQ